ncbi:uncharacterized protein LOC143283365 [Babylonia areolata]|uniref:uncharacterized protein LOC143283365 n=1 Tax=Babylonia areolata TaxID=304850 RepID=UPI003FCF6518
MAVLGPLAAVLLLLLLPVCMGTPAGLGGLGSFAIGGGAAQHGMGFPGAMMQMAAKMMSMAAQGSRLSPGQALGMAGRLRQQAGWASLPGPHGPGTLMNMAPPPPPPPPTPPTPIKTPGELMGGKFVGEHPPMGLFPPTGGKSAGGQVGSSGRAPPPPGWSSQLHLMEKLHDLGKESAVTPPAEKPAPVAVAADYAYFASKLAGTGAGGGGGSTQGPQPLDQHSLPIADVGHMLLSAQGPGSQPATDLHYYHDVTGGQGRTTPEPGAAKNSGNVPAKDGGQGPGQKQAQTQHHKEGRNPHPPPPPPSLSAAEALIMSNVFAMGLGKAGDQKQNFPEPHANASKNGGLGPIPGLTAPLHGAPTAAGSSTADLALRAPCDLHVDAVFALDDMKNLWLAREAIRYYETQLLPSKETRFGVVLCGQQKSFYTLLHRHFSALLASLEDLQHANATLDPTQHMPDTPGHRSDNNPYPPRVSEDFLQVDAGCLETAYHLLTYQSPPGVYRLLTVVGTKERWASRVAVEEAGFLHSLNVTLLTTASASLSSLAKDSLRRMASSPDKFRSVGDNVTLHALPAMIGSAVCRPQKADVTVAVERTATGLIQEPVVKECHQVDPVSMTRTMDFGPFFGLHTEHVRCPAGLVPELRLCACV